MSRIAPQSAFDILGVTPHDDFATIRNAWIRLVKDHHPDVAGGDIDDLTRKLARFNDAYDSLRWHNPDKVRIRERQAAGPENGDSPNRRDAQPPRATDGGRVRQPQKPRAVQRAKPHQHEAETVAPRDRRRIHDVLFRPAAPGEGIWTALGAADATALYETIRDICCVDASKPACGRNHGR